MIASRGESWGMLCVGQHYAAFCVPEEYRERQIKEVSKRGLAALKFPQNWWGRAREVGIKQHKNPPCRKESNGTQACADCNGRSFCVTESRLLVPLVLPQDVEHGTVLIYCQGEKRSFPVGRYHCCTRGMRTILRQP